MPIKRVRRKIHHLRKQPEDQRLRAASYVTLIGGIVLTALWVTVLLPLQLKFTGGGSDNEVVQQEEKRASNQNNSQPSPRVGGAQDDSPQLFHTAPPQARSRGTIVNSSNETESTREPQTTSNNQAEPSKSPETVDTVPVEVTE